MFKGFNAFLKITHFCPVNELLRTEFKNLHPVLSWLHSLETKSLNQAELSCLMRMMIIILGTQCLSRAKATTILHLMLRVCFFPAYLAIRMP